MLNPSTSTDLLRQILGFLLYGTCHNPSLYVYNIQIAALEAIEIVAQAIELDVDSKTGAEFRHNPVDYCNLFPHRRPRSRARRLRPWPRRAGRALRERHVQPAPRPARCVRDGGSGARLS